jgi:hypothetical protein
VKRLQTEQQKLKLQLRSLQHHQYLHKLHVKSATDTEKDAQSRKVAFGANLRLLEDRRRVLIDSHLTSIRGSHAGQYLKVMPEHIRLENRYRQLVASHAATRYNLQKLVIDAVHTRIEVSPHVVCVLELILSYPTQIVYFQVPPTNKPPSVGSPRHSLPTFSTFTGYAKAFQTSFLCLGQSRGYPHPPGVFLTLSLQLQAHGCSNQTSKFLPLDSINSVSPLPSFPLCRCPSNYLTPHLQAADSALDHTKAPVTELVSHVNSSPVPGSPVRPNA